MVSELENGEYAEFMTTILKAKAGPDGDVREYRLTEEDKILFQKIRGSIKESSENYFTVNNVPEWSIRSENIDDLKYEICMWKYNFQELLFFEKLPKHYWVFFHDHMSVEQYRPEEVIFSQGDTARYFYVIKSGGVYFELGLTPEEKALRELAPLSMNTKSKSLEDDEQASTQDGRTSVNSSNRGLNGRRT